MPTRSILAKDTVTGKIVHISEVPEGYEHAVCDDCGDRLIAANRNPDKREVAIYFRHQNNGGANCSAMTALHKYAQQILQEAGRVMLPRFQYVLYAPEPNYEEIGPLQLDRKGYEARLVEAALEVPYPIKQHLVADVAAKEPSEGDLYIEVRAHNKVSKPKGEKLKDAGLDVIEIDLRECLDNPRITKAQIERAVLFEAPRSWISQRRFQADIEALHAQLDERLKEVAERPQRLSEQRRRDEAEWRAQHRGAFDLLERYNDVENRQIALVWFEQWLKFPTRREYQTYKELLELHGGVPQVVDIPVRAELAFKVHRIYWQTLVFREVVQGLFNQMVKRCAGLENLYGKSWNSGKIAWQHSLPGVRPHKAYNLLKLWRVRLTDVANSFEQIAGEPLPDDYAERPETLRFMSELDYRRIPKPLSAIRQYFRVLCESGLLDEIEGMFYPRYQEKFPDLSFPIANYQRMCKRGLLLYRG